MRVVLVGWRPGLLKISLADLLREHAGYSLKSAKAAVDRLLEGESVEVQLQSAESARLFLQRATEIGAVGHLS